jgi:hypothetical protein
MPVTSGSLITAAFYNALQSAIATILGVGGYGQTVTSSQVSNIVLDQATHWNNLKTDIQLCRTMQQSVPFTDAQLPTISNAQLILASDTNLYESAVNTVVVNYTGNMMLVSEAFTDTRTTNWGSSPISINNEFTVDFGTAANANAFFTNGGEISFVMTQPTRPTPHDISWHNTFLGVGTVKITNSNSTRSGTMGTPLPTGWAAMTTTSQFILNGENLNATASAYGDKGDDLWISGRKNATGTGLIVSVLVANSKSDPISASTKLSVGYKRRTDMSDPTFAFNSNNTFNN